MNTDKALAEVLAEFAISLSCNNVKEDVLGIAKTFFLDAIACMIAGSNEKKDLIIAILLPHYFSSSLPTLFCMIRTQPGTLGT